MFEYRFNMNSFLSPPIFRTAVFISKPENEDKRYRENKQKDKAMGTTKEEIQRPREKLKRKKYNMKAYIGMCVIEKRKNEQKGREAAEERTSPCRSVVILRRRQ
jgi:hypothetical protein